VITLAVGSILFWQTGTDPITGYSLLFGAPLLTFHGLLDTLLKFTPLALISLGICLAFSSGFWNIGGEGQMLIAGIVVVWFASEQGFGSIYHGVPLLVLLGLIGFGVGAFWGIIPTILKTKLKVNEVITTLMFNFIAIALIDFLVSDPLRMWYYQSGASTGHPQSYPVLVRLPTLFGRMHIGVFVVIFALILVYLILYKSKLGLKIKAVGSNTRAARYAGIDIPKVTLSAMIFGGGLIGVAGMIEMTGSQFKFLRGYSPGYGYEAILIALIARKNPVGAVLMAFFIAVLMVGGDIMYLSLRVEEAVYLADLLLALMLLFMTLLVYLPSIKEIVRMKISKLSGGRDKM
jgi:simple sugar transport system permease protein